MSSSLKERLRRLSRAQSSPTSNVHSTPEKSSKSTEAKHFMTASPSKKLYTCITPKSSKYDITKALEKEATHEKDSCEINENQDSHQETKCNNINYNSFDKDALVEYLHTVRVTVSRKEEILRKLQMVKTYRSKNDLHKLSLLIEKWQSVSQEALKDLHSRLPEPKPSLTELIDALQIDHKLIKYDCEDNDFF